MCGFVASRCVIIFHLLSCLFRSAIVTEKRELVAYCSSVCDVCELICWLILLVLFVGNIL